MDAAALRAPPIVTGSVSESGAACTARRVLCNDYERRAGYIGGRGDSPKHRYRYGGADVFQRPRIASPR